jgi:hypothetical protein
VVLPFAYLLIWRNYWVERESMSWFSLQIDILSFALISALLFSAWAVLAVYRQMRLELQKPTAPTAWLAFLVFLLVYQTGLIYGGTSAVDTALRDLSDLKLKDATPFSLTLFTAGILLSALVYLAIFTEAKSMIGLRQVWDGLRRGDWRRLWLHFPRWAITLKFAAIATILIVLFIDLPASAQATDSQFDRLVIASFLFLLRNVGIVLLCNFMARSGRGDLAAIILLIVLSVIAPLIFGGASPVVASLFWPPLDGSWAMTLIPVLAQLVLVGGLLIRVWLQAEKQRNSAI